MFGLLVFSSAGGGVLVEIACLEVSVLNCVHGSTLGETQFSTERSRRILGGLGKEEWDSYFSIEQAPLSKHFQLIIVVNPKA